MSNYQARRTYEQRLEADLQKANARNRDLAQRLSKQEADQTFLGSENERLSAATSELQVALDTCRAELARQRLAGHRSSGALPAKSNQCARLPPQLAYSAPSTSAANVPVGDSGTGVEPSPPQRLAPALGPSSTRPQPILNAVAEIADLEVEHLDGAVPHSEDAPAAAAPPPRLLSALAQPGSARSMVSFRVSFALPPSKRASHADRDGGFLRQMRRPSAWWQSLRSRRSTSDAVLPHNLPERNAQRRQAFRVGDVHAAGPQLGLDGRSEDDQQLRAAFGSRSPFELARSRSFSVLRRGIRSADHRNVLFDSAKWRSVRRRLSPAANVRTFLLHCIAFAFLALCMVLCVTVTSAKKKSWVEGAVRLAMGVCILVFLMLWSLVIAIDVHVNLAVDRDAARTFLKTLRQALGLTAKKPGRLWRAIVRNALGCSAWVSLDAKSVLSNLLWAFPSSSVMISYRWAPEGDSELPRNTARLINGNLTTHNRAWLDVEELIPGTPTNEAVVAAVREACFRIVFLSAQYLDSANCRVELKTIQEDTTPGRTLFLTYSTHTNEQQEPLCPPSAKVEELRGQGHRIVPIESSMTFGGGELLRALIDSGAMRVLLSERSPRINAQWLATACALCLEPSWGSSLLAGIQRFPHALLLPLFSNLIVYLYLEYYTHDGFDKNEFLNLGRLYLSLKEISLESSSGNSWRADYMAGAIIGFWLVGLIIELYLAVTVMRVLTHVCVPRGTPLKELPDCALLLLVLRKTGLISAPVPVWNVHAPDCGGSLAHLPADAQDPRMHRVLRILAEHGALHLVGQQEAADIAAQAKIDIVSIVDLDECGAQRIPPPSTFECTNWIVAWSVEHTYKELSALSAHDPASALALWTQKVQHTIVAKPKRSEDMLESILCRILQFALTDGYDLGEHGAPLMQKKVHDLQACCKLYPGAEFEVPASDLAAPDAALDAGPKRFMHCLSSLSLESGYSTGST